MLLKKGSKGEQVRVLQKLLYLYPDSIFGNLTEEAVKAYQRENGLTPDGIVGDITWKKLNSFLITTKRTIKEIIVHCTATKEGKDYTIQDIKRWHKEKGYSDIGYHYIVYRDGSVHKGRSVDISGAHCVNHNANSVGVCYIGGLDSNGNPKDTRTDAQKTSLLKLLQDLKAVYPKAVIYGHCDFSNKACPSFNAKKEYATL